MSLAGPRRSLRGTNGAPSSGDETVNEQNEMRELRLAGKLCAYATARASIVAGRARLQRPTEPPPERHDDIRQFNR